MNIQEVKLAKDVLETTIAKLVNDFEAKAKCQIKKIKLMEHSVDRQVNIKNQRVYALLDVRL